MTTSLIKFIYLSCLYRPSCNQIQSTDTDGVDFPVRAFFVYQQRDKHLIRNDVLSDEDARLQHSYPTTAREHRRGRSAALYAAKMRMPDEITEGWTGMIENDFAKTIRRTFALPEEDDYLYQAEPFAMTLSQIQERVTAGNLTWKYWMHGQPIDVRKHNP